jgi:hypothetical protein
MLMLLPLLLSFSLFYILILHSQLIYMCDDYQQTNETVLFHLLCNISSINKSLHSVCVKLLFLTLDTVECLFLLRSSLAYRTVSPKKQRRTQKKKKHLPGLLGISYNLKFFTNGLSIVTVHQRIE